MYCILHIVFPHSAICTRIIFLKNFHNMIKLRNLSFWNIRVVILRLKVNSQVLQIYKLIKAEY